MSMEAEPTEFSAEETALGHQALGNLALLEDEAFRTQVAGVLDRAKIMWEDFVKSVKAGINPLEPKK